jgi:hypothetical protein
MGFLDRLFGKSHEGIPPERQDSLPESWPYELVVVPRRKAIETWKALGQEGQGRFWPVIHGNRWQFSRMTEAMGFSEDGVEVIVERGRRASFSAFLDRRIAMDPEIYSSLEMGEWPKVAATPHELLALSSPSPGSRSDDVVIGKIPTSHSWEVPGFLKYGGWNACPLPEDHMAALKSWEDRYGAQIVVVTQDTIECRVKERPRDKESALSLAREHYLYCGDVVDQGLGSVSSLAAVLMVSDSWYFWWD